MLHFSASATRLLPVAALLLLLTSCGKTKVDPTPATPTAPQAATPTIRNTSGTLVALRTDFTYSLAQAPVPVTLSLETGLAAFYNSTPTPLLDAGAVRLNNNGLDKQGNNAYLKTATPGLSTPTDLGLSSGASWSVAGSGSVPALSYAHTVSFPSYGGTLPSSIAKASGLSIALSGQLSGADSVYVVVAAGDKMVLKRARGTAASVSFSAAELAALPTTSNSTLGYVEVIPFRYNLVTLGGRTYAFVKETAAISTVTIQ
ncbi:hypothetical protein EJV47_27210 [Hymenobacter gummosus]|uniref:Uncharacterized protein n=1 Tax=Hymenobacter gummosus TaxID=1776032 RepID=A0A3S0IIQ9_9BACT|nr:hypothetical protein [Hymenobacter gummosus]RTQ44896.1 hypothetical protein EJV47_27210 [Hymenobacter gummosus]